MKNEEILRAMGDIKEEYIDEAAEKNTKGNSDNCEIGYQNVAVKPGKQHDRTHAGSIGRFGKWAGSIAAVLVIGICISGFGGAFNMGSSAPQKEEERGFYTDSAASEMYSVDSMELDSNFESYNGAVADLGAESMMQKQKAQYDHEVKLIYRANVSLQTTEFDETAAALKDMVSSYGGYFENTEMYNGGYFSDGSYRHAYYTIRIPQEHYADFIGGIQEASHVVDLTESVEDIGQEYFDTENHLATLRIKQERLQTLMKQATNMSDIIELENALSDTEYMIQMYTSTLSRYDSLIGFSTINVDIEKVVRYENGINQDEGFFSRLGRSFTEGLGNFVDALDNFVIWISYNFMALVIAAAIVFLIVKFQVMGIIGDAWGERRENREARRENRLARKAERQTKRAQKKNK